MQYFLYNTKQLKNTVFKVKSIGIITSENHPS